MIQYFELTPEILLEYIYEGDPKLDEDKIKGNVKDIYDDETSTMLLKSNAFGSKYLCFKNESEGLDSISNLVLPLNNTETQFVIAKSKYQNFYSKLNASNRYLTRSGSGYVYEDTNYDADIKEKGESCDVKYDKCIIHFTSRNYFGSYDSLIFQTYAYMSNKAKLYLSSFLFKKTSNLELKSEHLLYNEKLYTTQVEFDIPSVFAIFNPNQYDDGEGQKKFNEALKSQGVDLLENTPIGINVYGVSGSTIGVDNYVKLKAHKIKSISVPYIYNRLDEIHVNIFEDKELDCYIIDPEMGKSYPSIAHYLASMGEHIQSYMIMHELCLMEKWVDDNNEPISEITHKQYHLIDTEGADDAEISRRFDARITYRPVCVKGGTATIIDTIKIINTVDGSSYEVTGSIDIENPHKYGRNPRKLRSIDVQNRPIINVYNKKVSDEKNAGINGTGSGSILGLNKSRGFVVENMSQNITSFIECTNIGVSIVELSPEDIN